MNPALLAAFAYGSIYGSFLNVVVHRLPREESLVRPRSRCPSCGAAIAWYDNVPILSWALLRGRCRRCRKKISIRYPALEAAMGLIAALVWARWGHRPPFAVGATVACGALLALSLIDWATFIIPDELSLGLLALGLLISPLNPWLETVPRGGWWAAPFFSLRGALSGFLLGWGLAAGGEFAFKKEALGGGDVKLLAAVGAWSGFTGAFDCLLIGSLLGTVYALGLMLAGRARRSDPIPFGPFLAAGAAFNLFRLLPLGFPLI